MHSPLEALEPLLMRNRVLTNLGENAQDAVEDKVKQTHAIPEFVVNVYGQMLHQLSGAAQVVNNISHMVIQHTHIQKIVSMP